MKSWGFCYSTSKFFFFLFLIFSYFVFSSFLVKTTKYFQNSRKRKFYSAVRALFSIKYIFSRQRIFVFWLCHCSFRKPYLCSLLVSYFLLYCECHEGSYFLAVLCVSWRFLFIPTSVTKLDLWWTPKTISVAFQWLSNEYVPTFPADVLQV